MNVTPNEMVVELSRPVTLGSGDDATEFSEIRLQEPTVDHLCQFVRKTKTETSVDAMKFLISIVSGVPLPVLGKVGVRDFYKAQSYLIAFISPPGEDDPMGNVEGSR